MSQTREQYVRAHNAWVIARKNYKNTLNHLALEMQVMHSSNREREFDNRLTLAYDTYKPSAERYLRALKAYVRERPELTGRLMYDYLQEASMAQTHNRTDVSDQFLKSVEKMVVENVKVAHKDWVKNGNKDTMSAVFVAITDAQAFNVDNDSDVVKIHEEVWEHYEQGKLKRDPKIIQVKPTEKVPNTSGSSRVKPVPKAPKSKKGLGQIPTVYETIPWPPGR